MAPSNLPDRIRIATRESPLARYQADWVAAALGAHWPELTVETVAMKSEGDRVLDRPLAQIGGKGLFVKELEQGLLDTRADIAVHSMKDVPGDFEPGLHLPVICAREDPFDAFLSPHTTDPFALPPGAVVGTSSPRRASQLRHALPGCEIQPLRGNVNTRLAKLDAGTFDAIVLAVAGLERLDLAGRITRRLEPSVCLPAIGQGALGIECREGDSGIEALIDPLRDTASQTCVATERAVSRTLQGSCLSPIAGHARIEGDALWLRARVGHPDGSTLLAAERQGSADAGEGLGRDVAADLLAQGASELLAIDPSA